MSNLSDLPNIIKESSRGFDIVKMQDEFLSQRTVFLNSDVNADSVMSLFMQLVHLESTAPGLPINFYINSHGGSVSDGLAVYDLIRKMKSPVTTICVSRCCSMGAILFLAGSRRLILPHSEIMIHDASFASAVFSGLKPDEIQQKTDELLEVTKVLRAIVAERTGQTIKVVTNKMKRDSFFKSEEAVKFGLATEVITDLDFI